MNTQANSKGFTIIEVVLVLAIAGLIFLMVFIALPALQRNQRDTARRNDVTTVASAYTTATNNNRGSAPANGTVPEDQFGQTTGAHGFARYLDDLSDNTSSVVIRDRPAGGGRLSPEDGQIIIVKRAQCGDEDGAVTSGTNRQVALLTQLEGGSAIFCQTS